MTNIVTSSSPQRRRQLPLTKQDERGAGFFIMAAFVTVMLWPRYIFIPVGGVGLSPFSLSMLFLTFASLFHLTSGSGARRGRSVLVVMALFVLSVYISDINGDYVAQSFGMTTRNLIYLYAGALIGYAFFGEPDVLRRLPVIFTVVVIIVGMIGLCERIAFATLMSTLHVERFAAAADQVQLTASSDVRNGEFRAVSIFSHPIAFGQFVGASVAFVIAMVLSRRRIFNALGVLAITLILPFIYATGTRSSYIVVGISSLTAITLILKRQVKSVAVPLIIGIAGLLLICGLLAFGSDIQALIFGRNATEMNSSDARAFMIQTGLSALSQSPFFGFGEGLSALKAGMVGNAGVITIDSLYLTIVLDYGIIGLTFYALLIISIVLAGLQRIRTADDPEVALALIAMLAFCVGIFVGQSVLSIWDNVLYCYFFGGAFIGQSPRSKLRGPVAARQPRERSHKA